MRSPAAYNPDVESPAPGGHALIGRELGHFRITEAIGAGGMGVVYKATDLRLQRTVALKLLPPELSNDDGRRSRFEREARAASSLNHPNIVTVYEVDRDGELDFIAMEFVEGETLSAAIAKGLAVETALRYATQIARRPRGRARRGHRPPRPQAGQRDRQAGRPGEGAGLRPGQARRGRVRRHPRTDAERRASNRPRKRGGDARVHVAGAGRGPAARRAQRRLLVRRRALRDADGPAAVRGRQRRRARERDPAGRAATGAFAAARAARSARRHPGPSAREGRRPPLPAHVRRRRRPEAAPRESAATAPVPRRRRHRHRTSAWALASWWPWRWCASSPAACCRERTVRRCSSVCSRRSRAPTGRRASRPTDACWRSSTTRATRRKSGSSRWARANPSRSPVGETAAARPRWSPKGDLIVFERRRAGIWAVPPLGGPPRQILDRGGCASFFPDGERLVFDRGARAVGGPRRRQRRAPRRRRPRQLLLVLPEPLRRGLARRGVARLFPAAVGPARRLLDHPSLGRCAAAAHLRCELRRRRRVRARRAIRDRLLRREPAARRSGACRRVVARPSRSPREQAKTSSRSCRRTDGRSSTATSRTSTRSCCSTRRRARSARSWRAGRTRTARCSRPMAAASRSSPEPNRTSRSSPSEPTAATSGR